MRNLRNRLDRLEKRIPRKPPIMLMNPTCEELMAAGERHRRGEIKLWGVFNFRGRNPCESGEAHEQPAQSAKGK
jgi:hypothetical protein